MDATWKLEAAKARFSELVRRARGGAPQTETILGSEGPLRDIDLESASGVCGRRFETSTCKGLGAR